MLSAKVNQLRIPSWIFWNRSRSRLQCTFFSMDDRHIVQVVPVKEGRRVDAL